ncbi:hypothetical protein SAMN00808754_1704 [Thermanaeromonas toyohensis ToBE]|uniref:VWA domain containing CoxE-like protein n=1 Tax=Thermanaeromonas toyohensis ToBE TaxID=698762 RepID=A0A1W1VVK5_9FIRM|nr:VWA domain-containing protein [Thermanaeromonas toyohensis]SMB96894.1 hypothetical protein SAMN00808754_1704 [Thermanaeromonas toyohensis ToBE]
MLKNDTLLRSIIGFGEYARKKGLRVSTAEVSDAVAGLAALGPMSLTGLREALQLCMVKSVGDFEKFNEAFDEYFLGLRPDVVATVAVMSLEGQGRRAGGRRKEPPPGRTEQKAVEEDGASNKSFEAVGTPVGAVPAWASALASGKGGSIPESLKLYLAGQVFSAASELVRDPLSDADRRDIVVAVSRLAVEKLLCESDLPAVEDALRGFIKLASAVEKARCKYKTRKNSWSDFSALGRTPFNGLATELVGIPPDLLDARLERLDRARLALLTEEISRAAAALKPLIGGLPGPANRRRVLDYRKTLRASLATFGEPFRLCRSARRRRLRRLVTVCDVSGSVKEVTGLFLAFMYGLHQAFGGRVRHFVFVSEVDEVTGYFSLPTYGECFDRVVSAAAVDYRGYSNYGKMLKSLWGRYRDAFDHETVVLFLGDARTNRYDPEVGILEEISAVVKRTFFLNPEDPREWYTGDSAVAVYRAAAEFVDISRFRKLLEFISRLPGVVVAC